jgi:hypothetical protein
MSNYSLEVKLDGLATNRNKPVATVLWLDWGRFHVVRTSKRLGAHRCLVSDGQTAFSIARGKARVKLLAAAGFPDPDAKPEQEISREISEEDSYAGNQ